MNCKEIISSSQISISSILYKRNSLCILVITMIIVFSITYSDTDLYAQLREEQDIASEFISETNGNSYCELLKFISNSINRIHFIIGPNTCNLNVFDISLLRSSFIKSYTYGTTTISWDVTYYIVKSCWLTFGKLLMSCGIVIAFSILLDKMNQNLILKPVQDMSEIINQLASNPLSVLNSDIGKSNMNENPEIAKLKSAVNKMAKLAVKGFGDAGSEIIKKSISNKGILNPVISGRKVNAIIGFCDIRNFTGMTEVLEEEIVYIVNTIASIAHKNCFKFLGTPNKNFGDAFLFVWIPDNYAEGDQLIHTTTQLAELALLSTLRTMMEIEVNPLISKYNSHPLLREKFPNFKIKIGFALHYGWVIEGPVGTQYKVDASYISPSINETFNLEELTKEYLVNLILSKEFVELLSRDTKDKLVRRLYSESKLCVYTVDILYKEEKPKYPKEKKSHVADVRERLSRELRDGRLNAWQYEQSELNILMSNESVDFRMKCRKIGALIRTNHIDKANELIEIQKSKLPNDRSLAHLKSRIEKSHELP